MDEYLRRVQSSLGADVPSEEAVHAVLGGPEPDVDAVAATLCLALHLSQKDGSGGLCLPLLCGRPRDAVLPVETAKYLQRVKISERLLLWKEDVDTAKLHRAGRLSLTLLRDGLLDSSEYHTLESSVLRVVHRNGQQDAEDDGTSSAVATVAREILQDAAEHIRASLGETLGEALRLQSDALRAKRGRRPEQLEALRRSVEQWSHGGRDPAGLQYLEQLLTAALKEFSDGEMTVALCSVATDKDDLHDYVDGLKYFSHQHEYDALVVLLSVSDTVHQPRQQVVVYSSNIDVLNQICCELEESSSWSLSGELEARGSLQVYHIPMNTSSSSGTPPLLEEEIQGILKDFVDRRSSVLACNPSSRTSSTEGVAGSVEFSQGSSGINDMDGSDIERAEGGSGEAVAIARVMADADEDAGGVGVSVGGELVSPDSGMTTIRSSRSSKESSVFLSDDSPVGDTAGGQAGGPGAHFLRNPSPLGLLSVSPPVPPERKKHRSNRNRSEIVDLFSFDPLHSGDVPMPAGGELANLGVRGDEDDRRGGSSSLSEELSLLDFSAPNSLGELESRNSSMDHHGQIHGTEMTDTVVPPTPVNSLVGSRPPSSCGVRFFPEDVIERINGLQHKDSVSSSLSETWDELSFDAQGVLSSNDNMSWSRTKLSESPQNVLEEAGCKESLGDMAEKESRDSVHQRPKSLEPQLSLITEQVESYDKWNPVSVRTDQWHHATLADLQLTPPEEEAARKFKPGFVRVKENPSSLWRKKAILNTLTPETSREEDEGKKQIEILDFWTYSAQKGFLKSDSGTTTSYPESLDMWNTTIRDDSPSPLTTPDNLSDYSGSFCGGNANVAGASSMESPLGFCDGGMQMWNTTIREDSSSTIASPEGPENGRNLSHMGSIETCDSSKTYTNKVGEHERALVEDGSSMKGPSETAENVGWRATEHNVKIVIEVAGDRTQGEEEGEVQSPHFIPVRDSDGDASPDHLTNMWDLPVPAMVTSTSEYDNVGAGTWSLTSSPDTFASPVVDMIQLEGQSSPFIAVTKPPTTHEMHDQYQKTDILAGTACRSMSADKEQQANQVFMFEGASGDRRYESNSRGGSEGADWLEEPSDRSPFILIDCASASQQIPAKYQSSPGEATTDESLAQTRMSTNDLVSEKPESPESASVSHELSVLLDNSEGGSAVERRGRPNKEGNGTLEVRTTETMSLSSSSGGERDTLKYSPDSLHPGSRDELKSNSDGDSSSGLEMEYIIVSGTVKETEREWHDRPRQGDRQRARKPMETFSMLSYAATVLQKAAHRQHQGGAEQAGNHQRVGGSDGSLSPETEQNQVGLDDTPEPRMASDTSSPSRPEALQQSDSATGPSQTQGEEENCEDTTSVLARSVSPSLRYPVDHFLKTREEVYVHSQISMEDSDEGGDSPSQPPPCPTYLGDFQMWGGELSQQDLPHTASETQSPVLTNSSVSRSTSSAGTPLSESGASAGRGLGLPFSGDLMEEGNDEEEPEGEHAAVQSERQPGPSDLPSFTEEVIEHSSLQQTDFEAVEPRRDTILQGTVDYCCGRPISTVGCDMWLTEHGDPHQSYSPELRRGQDASAPLSSQPTGDSAARQWTGSQNLTQGQTQYGYNYHHIDQRTENQGAGSEGGGTKARGPSNATDVYAEFTSDGTAAQYRSESAGNYYEAGFNAEYSSGDPGSKFQAAAEIQYGENGLRAAELQYSADGQYDQQMFHQSDVQPEREDHARYVPEGYVHFLLSRHSQLGDGAAGMTAASSEEAAEEADNREDLSGGSNQRRKLAAPPMNVSLDHSEGSLLSEDALDTEDDALDTGDELDVSVDELDSPDEAESAEFDGRGGATGPYPGAGPASGAEAAGRAAEGGRDSRLWRSVVIGEQEHRIDMKCIEPYKRVISHGGYYAEQNAIIVFAACFLPDSDCDNYNYVMENLFLYVISTLELMVAEDYMIVYLNGATPHRRMPGFTWMKKCYQMIDRRLKKNLKMFIIVHPSWFIRTLLGVTRPFISSKFSSKIKYVHSLRELGEVIPMEYVHIPPSIVKCDEGRCIHKFACMRLDTDLQDSSKADKKGNSAV
ncbi:uncharacterized protein LOC114863216 isoform X3 [Betta splendens]|uniref:Uncharacterized protein LOC114863216 isoform X3 n=1 Tax=Betta splendens TaxID=158456 RepID=A0A6P7NPL0_BETSP|nr:uncharacterized protein LOC114863216 isoform X3 [Betta splendens]